LPFGPHYSILSTIILDLSLFLEVLMIMCDLKVVELHKLEASRFAPFWNEIIKNLREEDYISNQ
jgi:hypothetical protein